MLVVDWDENRKGYCSFNRGLVRREGILNRNRELEEKINLRVGEIKVIISF